MNRYKIQIIIIITFLEAKITNNIIISIKLRYFKMLLIINIWLLKDILGILLEDILHALLEDY